MAKGGGGGGGEGGRGEKKDEKGGPSHNNIVLKLNLHCEGCITRIRKAILTYPGVIDVEFEGENKVKVFAHTKVDAVKLRDKIQKKTLKNTELISPQPPKNDGKKKDNNNNNNNNNKPKELPVTTVNLKVSYHCDGCSEKLHKAVSSYKGVHEFNIEKDRVKVTGRVEPKKMAEELQKKLKKTVEVVNDKKEKGNNGGGGGGDHSKENGGDNGGGGDNKGKENKGLKYLVNETGYAVMIDGSGRVVQYLETPQIFSDENVNACTVM